jgi:hypothetical protein
VRNCYAGAPIGHERWVAALAWQPLRGRKPRISAACRCRLLRVKCPPAEGVRIVVSEPLSGDATGAYASHVALVCPHALDAIFERLGAGLPSGGAMAILLRVIVTHCLRRDGPAGIESKKPRGLLLMARRREKRLPTRPGSDGPGRAAQLEGLSVPLRWRRIRNQ